MTQDIEFQKSITSMNLIEIYENIDISNDDTSKSLMKLHETESCRTFMPMSIHQYADICASIIRDDVNRNPNKYMNVKSIYVWCNVINIAFNSI